jgi:Tat protein translocase TatB subunit
MDFFGIGPWEILLVLIVALIVVGPGRLPEIARTLGKTVRAIRRASAELTTAVTRELETAEKAEKQSVPPGKGEKSPSAVAGTPRAAEPAGKRTAGGSPTEPGGAPLTK